MYLNNLPERMKELTHNNTKQRCAYNEELLTLKSGFKIKCLVSIADDLPF